MGEGGFEGTGCIINLAYAPGGWVGSTAYPIILPSKILYRVRSSTQVRSTPAKWNSHPAALPPTRESHDRDSVASGGGPPLLRERDVVRGIVIAARSDDRAARTATAAARRAD